MRRVLIAIVILAAAVAVWRSQLVSVSHDPEPRPLAAIPVEKRSSVSVDVALPAVPVGVGRLRAGDTVLLVHYWAPWEPHARDQIRQLDSLSHMFAPESLTMVVVCFDPFPSVARFVARQRIRTTVLLDHQRTLTASLPCPLMPFTYVIDARGQVAVAQPGAVDWLAIATREQLLNVVRETPSERLTIPGRRAPDAVSEKPGGEGGVVSDAIEIGGLDVPGTRDAVQRDQVRPRGGEALADFDRYD
jgi:peroxiredoxin